MKPTRIIAAALVAVSLAVPLAMNATPTVAGPKTEMVKQKAKELAKALIDEARFMFSDMKPSLKDLAKGKVKPPPPGPCCSRLAPPSEAQSGLGAGKPAPFLCRGRRDRHHDREYP